MYNFACLTSMGWVQDYGFAKALAADPGVITYPGFGAFRQAGRTDIVSYWQQEKAGYRLWELLCYMAPHTLPQTLAYFDLPADTVPFVRWVYNHVAHEEREKVAEMQQDFFAGGFDQMNFFPYSHLYTIWNRESDAARQARQGNVRVYLDRITEHDGRELLRYQAPAFFE